MGLRRSLTYVEIFVKICPYQYDFWELSLCREGLYSGPKGGTGASPIINDGLQMIRFAI